MKAVVIYVGKNVRVVAIPIADLTGLETETDVRLVVERMMLDSLGADSWRRTTNEEQVIDALTDAVKDLATALCMFTDGTGTSKVLR